MTCNRKGASDDLHHIRSHQPVAPSHDRGHVCPQVRREDATRLPSPCRDLCQVPGPFAGCGNRRGPAPLSEVHQTETCVPPPSLNGSAVALRFLLTVTLG